MRLKLFITLIITFAFGSTYSQEIEALFNRQNFNALVKFADNRDKLTKEQLYYVGYAFFQLKDDRHAIEMYNKAIAKGLDSEQVYFQKGMSLQFDKQYKKATTSFKLAIKRNAKKQKYYSELGNSFYYQGKYDSALVYFYQARKLDFQLGDPYLKIPDIFFIQKDFTKALEEYKLSASLVDKNDPSYIKLLKTIGQLEYTHFENFEDAVVTYTEMISRAPDDYDLYPKLIKAYYADSNYVKGDSLFNVMKVEYEKENLSEEYQKFGSVSIDEYKWNDQKVTTFRYFKETKEKSDIKYKIYLLAKNGNSVERTLIVEKAAPTEEAYTRHVLFETEKSGIRHTYPHDWPSNNIDYASLKKRINYVLNNEVEPPEPEV
ncbi:MAG: hypothetical protein HRT72_03450, partial [Flavobacteriales bacterium]|nr:hypothetical protein [Flavobacteriales bacterium]